MRIIPGHSSPLLYPALVRRLPHAPSSLPRENSATATSASQVKNSLKDVSEEDLQGCNSFGDPLDFVRLV